MENTENIYRHTSTYSICCLDLTSQSNSFQEIRQTSDTMECDKVPKHLRI